MASQQEQLEQLLVEEKKLDNAEAHEAARIIALVPPAASEFLAKLRGDAGGDSPCTVRGHTAEELMQTYKLDEIQAYKVLAWLGLETASARRWLDDRLRDLKTGKRHMHEYA